MKVLLCDICETPIMQYPVRFRMKIAFDVEQPTWLTTWYRKRLDLHEGCFNKLRAGVVDAVNGRATTARKEAV